VWSIYIHATLLFQDGLVTGVI